jgi:hypothetical protein
MSTKTLRYDLQVDLMGNAESELDPGLAPLFELVVKLPEVKYTVSNIESGLPLDSVFLEKFNWKCLGKEVLTFESEEICGVCSVREILHGGDLVGYAIATECLSVTTFIVPRTLFNSVVSG